MSRTSAWSTGSIRRLPIYAGGLGILAGDHMKSAGDLHVPLIGIGLFWDEGYTRQVIGAGGAVEDHYPKTPRDALRRVDARVEVTVRGKRVPLRAWKVERYVTSTLYLLEPERDEDRWITQRLYGGGVEDRLAQEIVLGVGGVRLLRGARRDARRLSLQRGPRGVRGARAAPPARVRRRRRSPSGSAKLRPHVVFTTHTPVPAGNEVHDSS